MKKNSQKFQIWKGFGLNLNDCQANMDMNILKIKKNFAMNCMQLVAHVMKQNNKKSFIKQKSDLKIGEISPLHCGGV